MKIIFQEKYLKCAMVSFMHKKIEDHRRKCFMEKTFIIFNSKSWFKVAMEHIKKSEYNKAAKIFKLILQKHQYRPLLFATCINLANLCLLKKYTSGAKTYLYRAQKINKTNVVLQNAIEQLHFVENNRYRDISLQLLFVKLDDYGRIVPAT